MQRALRPSALVPRGFDVESAFCDGATTVITVRPTSGKSLCPGCGAGSRRIHSRYQRRLTDLPLAGRQVRLMLSLRYSSVRSTYFHRALRGRGSGAVGAANGAARSGRPSPRPCLGWPPSGEFCPSTYAARE